MKNRLGHQEGPDESIKAKGYVQAKLHQGAQRHLMGVLTGLYPDPVLAALREYSSNALDSHVRAGQSRPIEVTFPTTEQAGALVIEDFGLGMNRDDLEKYSSYGFSDKMETNEERGGFGLGSKSALALKRPFLVDTVKDGHRILSRVHAEGRNFGVFEFLEDEPTTRVNGTRITIPLTAEQVKHLQDIAENFFHYQAEGSVMVNGALVTDTVYGKNYLTVNAMDEVLGWVQLAQRPAEEKSEPVTYNSYKPYSLRVVVGGVVYDVPREQPFQHSTQAFNFADSERNNYLREVDAQYRRFAGSNPNLFVVLPIGSVDFISSRDAIELNPSNKSVITRALSRFFDMIEPVANVHLQTLPTRREAADFYGENWALFEPSTSFATSANNANYYAYTQPANASLRQEKPPVYRGEVIPAVIDLPAYNLIEAEITQESWMTVKSYWQKGQDTERAQSFPFFRASRGEAAYVRRQQKYGPEQVVIITTKRAPKDVIDKVKNNVRIFGQYRYESRSTTTYVTNAKTLDPWIEQTFDVLTYEDFLAEVSEARDAAKSGRIKKDRPSLKYSVVKAEYVPGSYRTHEVEATAVPAGMPYLAEDDCYRRMVGTFWQDLRTNRNIAVKDEGQALLWRAAGRDAVLLPSARSEANLHKQLPNSPSVAAVIWQTFSMQPTVKRESILALAVLLQNQHTKDPAVRLMESFKASEFTNKHVREVATIIKNRAGATHAEWGLAEQVALMMPGITQVAQAAGEGKMLVDKVDLAQTFTLVNPFRYQRNAVAEQKAVSVINFLHPAK